MTITPDIKWGSEVVVKVSRLHPELVGQRGILEQPPAGTTFWARLRIGSDVWGIFDPPGPAWELEPASPPGMPHGQDTFLWGEELHVKLSPDGRLQGLTGVLRAPPPESDLAGILWVGGSSYEIPRGVGWRFERVLEADRWRWCVEAPAGREKYIGTRFKEAPVAWGVSRWDAEDHSLEISAELARGWVFSQHDPNEAAPLPPAAYDHEVFVADLDAAVKEIRDLLVEKNQAYGNSALDPVRIFSKADPMEQLFVRIDDKLSRLKRGHAAGEDVVKDLQGYLLLVRVAQMRADRNRPAPKEPQEPLIPPSSKAI